MIELGKKKGLWAISPSQIKTIAPGPEGCERKWGFVYIEGIRGPSTPAQVLGTDTHSALESWYRDGTEPDTSERPGLLASRAIEVYPSREVLLRSDLFLIEKELSFRFEGVQYRGFADLLWLGEGIPTVADHKTSSDPKKWGLSERDLPTDPQALVYALWALEKTGAPSVNLQWTYLPTRGKAQALPVRATLSRDQVLENFRTHVHPVGKQIYSIRARVESGEVEKAIDLRANPEACSAFGGCPHASYCPRTRSEILSSVFETKGETMNLKDRLKNKKKTEKKSKTEKKVRSINSPEAPADPEIRREISKAIGEAPKKARKIAEELARSESADDARRKAGALLDQIGRAGLGPRETLLIQVSAGLTEFAPTKSRAEELDLPFAAGKTANAARRDGLIEYGPSDRGTYLLELTQAGRDAVAAIKSGEKVQTKTKTETEPESSSSESTDWVADLAKQLTEMIVMAIRESKK